MHLYSIPQWQQKHPHCTNRPIALGAPLAQCARSAGAVQLFGRLAVLETHTL